MSHNDAYIQALDACLPQTQCRLCAYDDCMAYARAVASGEADISRCHPGGLPVLHALAEVSKQDAEPFAQQVQAQFKAFHRIRIVEEDCIGCTKCIQACPVDAIIGSSKRMHTVLTDLCNGCDLCLPVCPVDCMHPEPAAQPDTEAQKKASASWRERYQAKQARTEKKQAEAKQRHQQQKNTQANPQLTASARKAAIEAARARVQKKKPT